MIELDVDCLLFFPVEGTGSKTERVDYSEVACCWVRVDLPVFFLVAALVRWSVDSHPHNKQYWPIVRPMGVQTTVPCGASYFPKTRWGESQNQTRLSVLRSGAERHFYSRGGRHRRAAHWAVLSVA